MTGPTSGRAGHASLIRALGFAAGLLLLADSISQLVQAAGPSFDFGSREWRVTNLRLLFTQVTPLGVGLLLVGQYLVGSGKGWGRVSWLVLVLGIAVLALAALYARDVAAVAAGLDGPPLGQLRRSSVQVLLSAGIFGLGLLLTALVARRGRATA